MRYAIFSDIHANLEACAAVLESLLAKRIERYLCAGDIVGYGADPAACIDRIREMSIPVVAGNHDWAAARIVGMDHFNPAAQEAVRWTMKVLDQARLDYLANLPLTVSTGDCLVVHSTLDRPQAFDYLTDAARAERTFEAMGSCCVCFVGHTHVPGIFIKRPRQRASISDACEIGIEPECKYIVNVGSVGQPRDADPRACFCIYDTQAGRISLFRVPYDLAQARAKILQSGLPEYLGDRLLAGH